MKKFFITAAVVIAVLTAVLPSILDAADNILLKETAVSLEQYSDEAAEVTLDKGDFVLFGSYLDEPILWQVLDIKDDGRALLMTHYVITFKAFDASGESEKYHLADSEKYGSAVWDNCTLKSWLNSSQEAVDYSHCAPDSKFVFGGYNGYADEKGFLCADNFSTELYEMISDDGVFLLSKSEFSSLLKIGDRVKTATKSALMQTESPYFASTSRAIWYWTSSPVSSNNVSVTTVTTSGGYYKALAFDGLTGVAPALYLESDTVICSGGSGSKTEPYPVKGGAEE